MKITLLTLLAILFTGYFAFSQSYLNKTRKRIEHIRAANDKAHVDKLSTDSTLIYKLNDPKFKPSALAYGFDRNNKCISEAYIEDCEECYQEKLLQVVGTKHSKWKLIDSTHYVYKNMELRTHYEGKPYAFVISVVK